MYPVVRLAAAIFLPVFACVARASAEGEWALTLRPHVTVASLGQPLPLRVPPLPTTGRIVFTADPGFPGTGTFSTELFAGDWKERNGKMKGTPSAAAIEAIVQGYLDQGSIQGIRFGHARRISAKNSLEGKELKNGTLLGKFVHSSRWTVRISQPKRLTLPVTIRLVAPFTAKRVVAR
jgi:hypothetical protein